VEKKALEDKVHRLEEEQRLVREAIGQDSWEDGASLVQELLAQSYGMRTGDPRKRQAPDDEEWWLEDPEGAETILPSPDDDGALRLSNCGMQEFLLLCHSRCQHLMSDPLILSPFFQFSSLAVP
jgi:hypothetical protein